MKDDGGPAFPHGPFQLHQHWVDNAGMSLRDYFAGQALSYLTNANFLLSAMSDEDAQLQIVNAANLAYRCADAMLKARQS